MTSVADPLVLRRRARALREKASSATTPTARDELTLAADEYEKLAQEIETWSARLRPRTQRSST